MDELEKIKIILREKDCPFFEDEEIAFYLSENGNDFNETVYQLLIVKSEATNLVLSGMETSDTSKYFRRLAQKYRKSHSGVLGGR